MTKLVWLHDFALNPEAFGTELNDSQTVYILDPGQFETPRQSLKRLEFQVTAALEAGAQVYRGDTVDVLLALCEEHEISEVSTFPVQRPFLETVETELAKSGVTLSVMDVEDFVPDQDYKLGRFFRYWNKAKKHLLKTT